MQAARSGRRRSPSGVACALCLCLAASLAQGADAPAWLSWSAPTECQNTPEVERRLEFLLGHPVDFGTLPPTQVRMGWSVEHGWAVRVTVELAEGPRVRALDAPSCADAFDVVALSLALILDPDFRALAPEPAAPSQPVTLSDPSTFIGSTPDPAGGVDGGLPNASVPVPPATAEEPRADAARSKEAAGAALPVAAVLSVAGAAVTDLNLFPVPQFGGGVQVALRREALRVEVEGDLLGSESTRLPRARYPVTFSSLLVGLRGCYELKLGERLRWPACLGGEIGSIGTRELGGQRLQASGLWLAAQVVTGPELAATSWLRAFARVRAEAPLVRHEFLLSEGTLAHELPFVGFQAQVGIAMDVTEFGGPGH